MSDDLVKSLEWSCRDPVTHEPIDDGDYSNATVSEVKQAIAEIARLRAELATARLVPPLNPYRWRGAINDALTNWMDSILDDETPKDALRRLIRYEVDAALDPSVSQSAADLVATARRKGMEQAVAILRARHRGLEHIREWREAQYCADEIEAEIRAAAPAAAKEGKP